MTIVTHVYDTTGTLPASGGEVRWVPWRSAYARFVDAQGVDNIGGIQFFGRGPDNLRVVEEWSISDAGFSTSEYQWAISAVSGRVMHPTGGGNSRAVQLRDPVTLAVRATFGSSNTGTSNSDSNIATPKQVDAAKDGSGNGYFGCLKFNNFGFYIFTDSLVPYAWDNSGHASWNSSDEYSQLEPGNPDPATGKPRWFQQVTEQSMGPVLQWAMFCITPNDIPNPSLQTVGISYTEAFVLTPAQATLHIGGLTPDAVRLMRAEDAGLMLAYIRPTTGTTSFLAAFPLEGGDGASPLWVRSYPNTIVEGPANMRILPATTRGRFVTVGSVGTGASTGRMALVDLYNQGAEVASGLPPFLSTIAEITQHWDSVSMRHHYFYSGYYHAYEFTDFNIDTLDYSRAFELPLDAVNGFRSFRLQRSNVTGVLNNFFEDLQTRLVGYQDANGETLAQQPIDMNDRKIVNVGPAIGEDDLIRKDQAEGLA